MQAKKHNMSETGHEILRQQALKLIESNRGKPCTETRRENIRISKLGHGVTDDTKEKLRIAMSGENNPNYGKQRSEETKAKIRAAKLGKHHTAETKQIIRMKRANQVFSEETRKKMSESHKGFRNPNYGKSISEEQRIFLSEINSGSNNPMYGTTGGMSGKHHSEETKALMSSQRQGEKHPNWNGGPKEYCIKFKYGTFRNRCRSFFNNTCVLCGKPAGEETLDVHHVYYNKKACCEISADGKYYSNLGIKGDKKTFEIIGNPDKFVALHHKCHSLTTPIPEREKYARLFEKIINDRYDGKCYFTEDEYRTLTM